MEKQASLADTPPGFDRDPRWQLLQRILASAQFVRSARLKTFLQYVTRCALLDHAEQVTEQQIGMHVFARPADYSAGEDNIVRSQARFLRAKLTEYFESEAGREEPLVLTIPKGSYLPHFDSRIESPVHAPDPPTQVAEHTVLRRQPSRWPWVVAAAALLCITGAVLLRPRLAQPPRSPDVAFWSRLFDAHHPTTIVASDYIYSMVQEAAGRTVSLDEYLSGDYYKLAGQLNTASGLERLFPNLAQRHYTGFENVTCIARFLGLKQAQSTRTVLRFAREMTMRDMQAGNLILLGSKQSDPWDWLFEDRLNFHFEFQNGSHMVYIVNREPRPGEQATYQPSALDALSREIYGGIAFLPNVNGQSNVLILQGTSMAAPEAELEILDNPALLRNLARHLGAAKRDGELPYFEALIHTRTLNGVASESTVIASRVLGE